MAGQTHAFSRKHPSEIVFGPCTRALPLVVSEAVWDVGKALHLLNVHASKETPGIPPRRLVLTLMRARYKRPHCGNHATHT